jgi:hypothetical protein
MESPDFFEQLRQHVLALAEPPPVTVSCRLTAAPGQRVSFRPLDDRVARLNDVMTDAIRGAGGVITPGATAPDVWVGELVAYAESLRRNHGPTIKLRKIQLDWTIQTSVYRQDGTEVVGPVSHSPVITDVFGLAADYLGHLTSRARAKHAHKKANEQALRSADRKCVQLSLDELEWTATQWALEAAVGPAVAIDYLSGKTIKFSPKSRSRLTKALNDALKAQKLPPIVLPK